MSNDILEIHGEGSFRLVKSLVGYKADIERQLERFPYGKNVFLMLKFRESNKELSKDIIETLEGCGLQGVRADSTDWNITSNVNNPLAVLYCCKFGIALFDEPEEGQTYSPNVAYELGMMHYQGKECLILRHKSLPPVPFDLIKDLHNVYDRDLKVRPIVGEWVKRVERISESPNPPAQPERVVREPWVDRRLFLWELEYGKYSGPMSVSRLDSAMNRLRDLYSRAESGETEALWELEDRARKTWEYIGNVYGGAEAAGKRQEITEMLERLLATQEESSSGTPNERDDEIQRVRDCLDVLTWSDRAPGVRLEHSMAKLGDMVARAESGEMGTRQEFESEASREALPLIEMIYYGREADLMREEIKRMLGRLLEAERRARNLLEERKKQYAGRGIVI